MAGTAIRAVLVLGVLLPMCTGLLHRMMKGNLLDALSFASVVVWSFVSMLAFWLLFPYGPRAQVLCLAIASLGVMLVLVAMTPPTITVPPMSPLHESNLSLRGVSPHQWPEFAHLHHDDESDRTFEPTGIEVIRIEEFALMRDLADQLPGFKGLASSPRQTPVEREIKVTDA